MIRCQGIDLLDLLSEESKDSAQDIFSDNRFGRVLKSIKIDAGFAVEVLTDYIRESGIRHHDVSLTSSKADLCIKISGKKIYDCSIRGLIIACGDSERGLLWLPKQPVAREWDNQGRIKWEQELDCNYESKDDALLIKAKIDKQGCIEFPVVQFVSKATAFLDEIRTFFPQETTEYIKGDWFTYKDVSDIWNYVVKGDVYDPRNQPVGRRWRCEQCAHTLYYHLNHLEEQTNKKIYAALQDLIAYSVMLSLPSDGRWRHGHWTPEMETHTRFQVDGIHLLLTHYEKTGKEVFLGKAKLAMDYLISIADTLSEGGIWFLHDSLEVDEQQARFFYGNLISSKAFGKSISNTLCLNTHLWTMTALHRLTTLDSDPKYEEYLERGLKATQKVLEAEPAQLLYLPVYLVRDFLIKVALRSNRVVMKKVPRIFDRVFGRFVIPYMKKVFPRLKMPNGFIERDLSSSALPNYYYIQNLKDLLVLYKQTRREGLLKIIEKSLAYALQSGLVKHFASRDQRAVLFLDVLLLYSSTVNDQYDKCLLEYIAFFLKEGLPLSAHIHSFPLITNASKC